MYAGNFVGAIETVDFVSDYVLHAAVMWTLCIANFLLHARFVKTPAPNFKWCIITGQRVEQEYSLLIYLCFVLVIKCHFVLNFQYKLKSHTGRCTFNCVYQRFHSFILPKIIIDCIVVYFSQKIHIYTEILHWKLKLCIFQICFINLLSNLNQSKLTNNILYISEQHQRKQKKHT